MRHVLSLGIKDPLARVLVWLVGCSTLSIAAAVGGLVAAVVLGIVYAFGVTTKLTEPTP